MKFINKNKSALLLLLVISMTLSLKAQHARTDASVIDQYKNNTVPGLQYAPAAVKKTSKQKPFEGSSLVHEIKTGTTPGMQFAPGTGQTTTTAAKKPVQPATQVVLPSEMTQEQMKAAADKRAAEKSAPVVIPSQEEKPKEEKATKTDNTRQEN